MSLPVPKKRPERPKKRRPRRTYVVVDQATEDSEAANQAIEAWLAEPPPR